MKLTQDALKEVLSYDPETGVFVWKSRRRELFTSESIWKMWNSAHAGKVTGSVNQAGHLIISVFDRRYMAHRLAWLYVYGDWPENEIDHINGDPADNRMVNLRDVPHSRNMKNLKRQHDNKSGHTGVIWHKGGSKWMAYIGGHTKRAYLGLFENKADAIAARKRAEAEHGFHPNHGRE